MQLKIVIVLIAAIALLGGGYYVYTRGTANPQTQTEGQQQTGNNSSSSGQSFAGSLSDLLTLGQNYFCTFDSTDDTGTRTLGTAYVASGGNKFSGEFELTQLDGTTMTSNVVSDGEFTYIWSSELAQGLKSKIDPQEPSLFGQSDTSSDESTGIDENANMDFNCQPWVVDNSKFVPPSNIEFVEFSVPTLETLPQATEDAPNCSACDQVPAGASRDQCLTALGC